MKNINKKHKCWTFSKMNFNHFRRYLIAKTRFFKIILLPFWFNTYKNPAQLPKNTPRLFRQRNRLRKSLRSSSSKISWSIWPD